MDDTFRTKDQIQLNFNDGTTSIVDPKVAKLIGDLQNTNSKLLPFFFDLGTTLNNYSDLIIYFYAYILLNRKSSRSQLFQDLFVTFNLNEKRNGTFLEFGATDGINLSNSYLLENSYNWNGILSESNPQWHESLKTNRPNSKIINDCVYSESGKELDFFVSNVTKSSTLEQYGYSDHQAMPGNTEATNCSGYTTKVLSISLNDIFIKYFDSSPIDYMSLDKEGSELNILRNFDFQKFGPKIVTVAHNFTDQQKKLDELFASNSYVRHFKEHTQFEAWYVRQL